jgi:hypothetical protein
MKVRKTFIFSVCAGVCARRVSGIYTKKLCALLHASSPPRRPQPYKVQGGKALTTLHPNSYVASSLCGKQPLTLVSLGGHTLSPPPSHLIKFLSFSQSPTLMHQSTIARSHPYQHQSYRTFFSQSAQSF